MGGFVEKIDMCQSRLLSYEYFTQKTFLLGRTQCQEFDCLYQAKRYGQPCTLHLKTLSNNFQKVAKHLAHYFFCAVIFQFHLQLSSSIKKCDDLYCHILL